VAAVGRRSGDEEDVLPGDERVQLVGDRVEGPPHQIRALTTSIAKV
jgi:hypothetical protein